MEPMMLNTALLGLFNKKLNKMNAKAAKLGMPAVDVTFGATVERPCASDTIAAYKAVVDGRQRYVALYTAVFLQGEAPVIAGYRCVAVVDLMGEKPVVKRVPFASDADLTRFFDTDCHCDHCNTNRFRKDVLVVEDIETGELMQIGRNCANDFFGTKDAKQRVAVSDWIESYGQGNEGDNLPRGEITVSVQRIYEVAAACVRTWGWVHHKDSMYDDTLVSTKARVWANLFPWPTMEASEKVTVTDEDRAEAEVVMQWLDDKFLSVEGGNDFQRNVKAAVEGENVKYVRYSNINFLIWGIAGYKRDLQKDAEERRRKMLAARQRTSSDHVGTPGARDTFELTLQFKRAFGSDYGVRYLQKFTDADGNVLVWWGTNDTAARTVVGNPYVLKATVKGHEEYDGIKQTCLTRATLIEGDLKEEVDA